LVAYPQPEAALIRMSSWDTRGGDSNSGDNVVKMPLRIKPARLPDPRNIPPRPWLYGRHLLRGFVTVMVAPGGVGKTQVAMGIALCLASGKKLLGHYVHKQVNAWIINLEDPLDELDRRIAAMMIYHKLTCEELSGTLFLHSGRERPLCVARCGEDGSEVVFPDKEALIAEARMGEVGVIVVDPYVRSHELDENSNTLQAQAAAAWAQIAEDLNAAILLVHHTRKGAVLDVDSARGAKALTDHARAALIVAAMTAEEAETFGIKEDDRWRYIRVDDAKANLAPKATEADWYAMTAIALGNVTPDYPQGDNVTAIAPWKPPSVWTEQTAAALNGCLDIIGSGKAGFPYAPSRRGRANDRWAGTVLVDELGITDSQADQMIKTWLKNQVLLVEEFRDANRMTRQGVSVNDSKRPT